MEKNSHANAGGARDASLIPESGRSPGVGNGNPLHGQRILAGHSPWGCKELRLDGAHVHACAQTHTHTHTHME